MTLATHAVVGAAAAQLFPHYPVAAFAAGFVSHLAVDALPHWDYSPKSMKKDLQDPLQNDMVIGTQFIRDLFIIGGEALFGFLLSIYIFCFSLFAAPLLIVMIGALAGILPDPLQFVYYKTRSRALLPLQTFHQWLQKGRSLDIPAYQGIGLQVLLVLVVIAVEFFTLK